MKPFANVRRDVWLRSLPCRAPKDSPEYQAWHAANVAAQQHANRQPLPARACECGCGVSFVPRYRTTKLRPECAQAREAARLRRRDRRRSPLAVALARRAELQRRSA